MKTVYKLLTVLLRLGLCLCLLPAAFAEAPSRTREYGDSVITAFKTLGGADTITIDHKLALVTLQKRFPSELTVRLGGAVTYAEADGGTPAIVRVSGFQTRRLDVAWCCVENYDEDLDVFHFTPTLDGYLLAEGLEPPVITVVVEDTFAAPPPGLIPHGENRDVPIVGAISENGMPIQRGTFPAYFNSYKAGMLPPVRNQGEYGTCWAFAALGAMEADLIHQGEAGTDIDLSELHLAYFAYHSYFDEKNCGEGDSATCFVPDYINIGGADLITYRTLANMVGGAMEAEVPYAWAADYCPSPYAGRAYSAPQLTGAYKINPRDTDAIKAAIMEHGGISAVIGMYSTNNDYYYSSTYNSYYSDLSDISPQSHSVMLVGWDDSFPRDHFRQDRMQPSADGAWLARNSWGVDDYDFKGYFWMSYEEASLCNLFIYMAEPRQYQHCYAYDAVALPGTSGDYGSTADVSQIFTVDGGERIEAVGIETMTARLALTVSLRCGEQSVSVSTSTGYPGFYLIPLSTPLTIAERSEVTMELTLSGEGTVTVPIQGTGDYVLAGAVNYHAECASGGVVINGENQGVDGRLKLYTNDCDVPGSGVAVSAENFPNPSFRAWVAANLDLDHDKVLSAEEIDAVKTIDVSGGPDAAAANTTGANAARGTAQEGADGTDGSLPRSQALTTTLKGVEYFSNLETLRCAYCQLTALDLSGNPKLRFLDCRHNPTTRLDLTACPALAALVNQMVGPRLEDDALLLLNEETGDSLLFDLKLKLTPALRLGAGVSISEHFPDESFRAWVTDRFDIDDDGTLVDLELSRATEIDVSDSKAGPIASLQGIEVFPALKKLNCYTNPSLTALDVSGCSALEYLSCGTCQLEQLKVGVNTALRELYCNVNRLTALDVHGCTALETLNCRDNKLESLDTQGCTALTVISCRNNCLTGLDLSDCPALSTLYCDGNPFTGLDLRGCPKLLSLIENVPPAEEEGYIIHTTDSQHFLRYGKGVATIPSLPDLILPADLAEIGDAAFAGGAFTHAKLPEGAASIGARAFADCPQLAYVYIPAAACEIAEGAFEGAAGLTILGEPNSTAETYAAAHGYSFAAVA